MIFWLTVLGEKNKQIEKMKSISPSQRENIMKTFFFFEKIEKRTTQQILFSKFSGN